jgi:hypothetical protein
MASLNNDLDLSYDERNDVLYASQGSPQTALSFEIAKDIWLDYIPPSRAVVGITILNFSKYYSVLDKTQLLTVAKPVVQGLLQRFSSVPADKEMPTAQMASIQDFYAKISISTVYDAESSKDTHYFGMTPALQSLDIQSSPVHAGAPTHEGDDVIS